VQRSGEASERWRIRPTPEQRAAQATRVSSDSPWPSGKTEAHLIGADHSALDCPERARARKTERSPRGYHRTPDCQASSATPSRRMSALVAPPLALYVHFPWCIRKCPYCDFNSYTLKGELAQEPYVARLARDIAAQASQVSGRLVRSVFFGGGTPSLFSP